MKLLFCTPDLPFPPTKGTALRNYALLKHLARRHSVALLTFAAPDAGRDVQALAELGVAVETVPVPPARGRWRRLVGLASSLPDLAQRRLSRAFAGRLRVLLVQDWDIVQFEGLEMAPYLLEARRWRSGPRPLLVLDEHNAEYQLQRSGLALGLKGAARLAGALWSAAQLARLRDYERKACLAADGVVAVSPEDSEALRALAPGLDVHIVPNGLDVNDYPLLPARWERPTLLFTGTLDYRPNVDAVQWFCREVLPLIQRSRPEVELLIVGRSPTPAVRALAGPGVRIVGDVPEIADYFAQATVYVVPMRMGSGVRFKVLEAMARGLPVVSTPMGLAGIPAVHGTHCLRAEGPQAFAQAVLQLIESPRQRSSLVEAARRLVAQFDWSLLVPKLEALYVALLQKARDASGTAQATRG